MQPRLISIESPTTEFYLTLADEACFSPHHAMDALTADHLYNFLLLV